MKPIVESQHRMDVLSSVFYGALFAIGTLVVSNGLATVLIG